MTDDEGRGADAETVDDDDEVPDHGPEVAAFLRQVARADAREPAALIPDPLLGTVLDGKYRIDSLLGRGGMGTVYAATHLGTRREVALKVLVPALTADEAAVERFGREARAAGQIRHPNVVDVTDFGFATAGEHGARLAYLVMERLRGQTLRALLDDKGALPLADAVDVLTQIGAAVAEAHRSGILHRDLKPENIHLEPGPHGHPRVKVIDFGIARLVEAASDAPPSRRASSGRLPAAAVSPLASTGATGDLGMARTVRAGTPNAEGPQATGVIGTPRYMSPEQWRGDASDARTDIYSLGVMAYEMLAGEPPFRGAERAIRIEHAESSPRPLTERAPTVPPRIARVIEAALAKDPAARPPSAAAFVAGLSLGMETTAGLLWRSLILTVDHFALFMRRSGPLAAPPVVMALVAVILSLLGGFGIIDRHVDRIVGGALRAMTILSVLLWAPVTGSLVPVVAALVAGRSTLPAPLRPSETWRSVRHALPATVVSVGVFVPVAISSVVLVGWGAKLAGFSGKPTALVALFVCVLGSALIAPFALIGPSVMVEGLRGLEPLRRSAKLTLPAFRAAFGVTLFYQVVNQGLPDLLLIVLRALIPAMAQTTRVDPEALRELLTWTLSALLTPFVVVPSALLYLRAREAEGNPLLSA